MIFQDTIQLSEKTRGSYEITELVAGIIEESGISVGTCNLFLHSSTSLSRRYFFAFSSNFFVGSEEKAGNLGKFKTSSY